MKDMRIERFLLITAFVLSVFICLPTVCFAEKMNDYTFVPVYIDDVKSEYEFCSIKGNVYIPIRVLKKIGDCSCFDFDEANKKIYVNPADINMYIGDAETTEFIKKNAGAVYFPLKSIKGENWVSLNVIADFAKLAFSTDASKGLSNDDENDITKVYVTKYNTNGKYGKVRTESVKVQLTLESGGGTRVLKEGDIASVTGETSGLYKIKTLDGYEGYVMKGDFTLTDENEIALDYMYLARVNDDFNNKFNLIWTTASNGVSPLPPDAHGGIDVVSPCWIMQQVNGNGNVTNWCDRGYVDLCHERGYKVWATTNNNFTATGFRDYTNVMLASEALRSKTIAQYLFYACVYDIDGFTLDFESMSSSASNNIRTNYALFVSELYKHAQKLGLTVGVDVAIPTDYNDKVYDYASFGRNTDYVIMMTYDEHYSGSTYAGSVSDQAWYTAAIERLSKDVPVDKIVMGVPFYTRVWTVKASGVKISSYATTMTSARSLVESRGLTPEWLADMGQYFVEYTDNGSLKRIWLENARSIANRLSFVYQYKIAGTACWKDGQEEDGIYDVFKAIYKDGASPGSFNAPY